MTNIDIFSGFLGAGKTTLIKKLIKESFAGQKVVLIENEFGEIGIDGGFLKESGIQSIDNKLYYFDASGVQQPATFGIDVSKYQSSIDWDKVKEFLTSLYLKVVLVLSLIAGLIYGLWLLCANWNRRKPTKKIHRRY